MTDISLTGFIGQQTPRQRRVIEQTIQFTDLPDVMLAKKGHPSMLDNPNMFAETKWDGTRVLMVKRGDIVRIFVARGQHNEYTEKYPNIIIDGRKLNCESCILDGEFVFFDRRGHDVFMTIAARPETVSSLKYKYMAFDILEKDGQNTRNMPIMERKRILDEVIPDNLTIINETKIVTKNKKRFFASQLASNHEGVMLKRKGSLYTAGRSDDWRKIKRVDTIDVIAKGGTRGTGARAPYFGAIHMFLPSSNSQLRHVGDVGTGFDNQTLKKLTPLVRSGRPFVIEVKFMEWTPDRKMRFPVFIRYRDDKTPQDIMEG